MTHLQKTRRDALESVSQRAPMVSLGGDKSEISSPLTTIQAARITRRIYVSDAVARCLAEHAFSKGSLR